jgi:hypothetical protein
MKRKIQELENKIARIKSELTALGDLRPGSLSEQYNVCGRPHCRCKASPPQRHGPYCQLSYTRNGKSSTRFVRQSQLRLVQQQAKNYARLRQLVDRWIELATALSELKLANFRE